MFATSARMRPWKALWRFWSVRRETFTAAPSTATEIPSGSLRSSLPFGPWTKTEPPFTSTLTPEGIATGCLPIRDMRASPFVRSLVDGADDLAADPLRAGLAVGQDPLRGREDRDAEAVQDERQGVHLRVDAPAGLGRAVHERQHVLALGTVLEVDLDPALTAVALLGLALDLAVVEDVPLALHDLGNAELHLRARDPD